MTTYLDHIVLAAPDLDELVSRFTSRTGIRPVRGGRHDVGTANAIVPLAGPGESYLELIGPDPQADEVTVDNFGLLSTRGTEPRVAAWCVRPDDLDELAGRYRTLGIEPNEPEEMSRQTPDGDTLRWRLLPPKRGVDHAPVPFAIDWLGSAHPSTTAEAVASVHSLVIQGEMAVVEQLAEDFPADLTEVLELREGETFLELKLDTPDGLVNLRDL